MISGMLLSGALAVFAASLIGGATGFGFALLSTSLLLALGFPVEFVVTANLALAVLTRMSTAYRFRDALCRRRALMLIAGSLPGLYLGGRVLTLVDTSIIKLATGVLVMVAALLLIRSATAAPPPRLPGAPLVAGLGGGFLATTTSLSGIPPALLLARDKVAPRSFQADLASYFVISHIIALALLTVQNTVVPEALLPAALLWLPGSLLGNFIGATYGTRLPELTFRYLTLAVVFVAGGVTVTSAL
jgi:uncharacterized protein